MRTWIAEQWVQTRAGYLIELLSLLEEIDPPPWKRLGKHAKGPWTAPF